MQTVELIPLVGAVLEGRTLRLESGREEVEELLGPPEAVRWNSLYYYRNELRVDFDPEGQVVEFIELLGGPEGELQPVLNGMEVFQEEPEAVLARLRELNGGQFLIQDRGYSYSFQNLCVGLYRESLPEDAAGLIEEAEADGHPLDEEEIAAETRRTHWATVGLGAEGYYGYV